MVRYIEENEPKLTDDQRIALDTIIKSVQFEKSGLFSLDAPGCTGKTFQINLLLANARKHKWISLAVASSGIAATQSNFSLQLPGVPSVLP